MAAYLEIDVSENTLRRKGNLLDVLLRDQTTGKNLLWATDAYAKYGRGFALVDRMRSDLVTGVYGKLIQPRAAKSREEQKRRTKDKAEVFTPLQIVRMINGLIDRQAGENVLSTHTWKDYVAELKLEIACGEAPFIASRYNPTANTRHLIKLENRVGFLDRKLQVVSRYCDTPKEWLKWAKIAFQSSYGYEWQGDNVLLARENLLYTFIDYYRAKFHRNPTLKYQEEFAEIISCNIFQMDGIRNVIPMSCKHESITVPGDITLFGITQDTIEEYECEGCKFNRATKHNGKYAVIMDWETQKKQKFVDLFYPEQSRIFDQES